MNFVFLVKRELQHQEKFIPIALFGFPAMLVSEKDRSQQIYFCVMVLFSDLDKLVER